MDQHYAALLDQLLDDPAFGAWVRGNNPDADEAWHHWAQGSPGRREVLEKARAVILAMETNAGPVSDEHIDRKIREALAIARNRESGREQKTGFRRLSGKIWAMGIAASLLMALGIVLIVLRTSREHIPAAQMQQPEPGGTFVSITNKDRMLRYVQLPDGSSVVLHKNSSIQYPRRFATARREVSLTGEAFFEIIKNPDQPFFVYAHELVAKVHGTSFSIKADESDREVVVAVKTGKVSVFASADVNARRYQDEKELTALVLVPREQATFERAQARLVRSQVKTPMLLNIPIEDQLFTYSETPAGKVFDELGQAYGVAIRYDAEVMGHCSITATLGDEPLENKLRWICTILEADFEILPEMIIIKGNPCK
ncbi:FecR family protein [Dyadobacter sandarakinus]|uniref:FecR family protein n=1 Tax=Dyadobacter sandarakinus TaxID=2747268 RepID=A0ABX7IEK2_9BACT|nr:FecR family protein [Dyadobacter sandarakinus]QRR03852.1 FecR family protein [Dyadobacter sandarakinus]